MPISRREFGRLAAATAASGMFRTAMAQRGRPLVGGQTSQAKPVSYCVVGLGRISVGHFMPGVKASSKSRISAVVSGHPDKAARLAAEYGLPPSAIYSYDTYDKIRDDPNIDAVYIGLPNGMHGEYTVRAAQAGKHVLCEKPMAATVAESESMIAACAKANKKLMIAYRCQLESTNLRAIELIRSGAIGTVQAIESANGFNIQPGEWRLNKKLAGGGPLMDVGIYSLNACRYLTGEEPLVLSAYSSVIDHDGRFDQVEENISWTMKFPSGILASCNSSYGASMNGYYRVHGSKGMVQLEPAFGYEGLHLTAHLPGDGKQGKLLDEPQRETDPAQFTREADYFSSCIRQNTEPKPSGEEGLRDMNLMQQIYASAHVT